MTIVPTQADLDRAHAMLYGTEPWPEGKKPGDHETARISPASIAKAFAVQRAEHDAALSAETKYRAQIIAAHDARVTELLDANNQFEQRARDAERTARELKLGAGESFRLIGRFWGEQNTLAELLRDMRNYAIHNQTRSVHDPIWARVADALEARGLNT